MASHPARTAPTTEAEGPDIANAEGAGAPDNLESIVARAGARDGEAWRALIERYARRIYALAKSRLHDEHLAEEVSQAVIVSVFQSLTTGRYKADGAFEAWLFRIAMNRVRDHVRRRARRPAAGGDEMLRQVASVDVADTEFASISKLRMAIAELPESDQEVLSLRHQAGLDFKSIAELLNEPVGTLLARHHRALGKLRERLGQESMHENTP